MKIKELLKALEGADPNENVWFTMNSGCCGDFEELTVSDTEYYPDDKFVRISFESLPGYRSCIQAGNTKQAHEDYWKKVKGS